MDKLVEVLIKVESDIVDVPSPMTSGSAGMDLEAAIDEPVHLKPGERALIPTGIKLAIPDGYEGQVRPRSGLAIKHGITLLNSPGTIDADYRGEVKVIIINHGQADYVINPKDRIAQLVVAKVAKVAFTCVEMLDDTKRNDGGFGHTGN